MHPTLLATPSFKFDSEISWRLTSPLIWFLLHLSIISNTLSVDNFHCTDSASIEGIFSLHITERLKNFKLPLRFDCLYVKLVLPTHTTKVTTWFKLPCGLSLSINKIDSVC